MFLLRIWFWDDHSCFVFGQSIFLIKNNKSQFMSHTRLPVQSWVDNHKYAHHYCLDRVHHPRCPFQPVRWLVGDGGRPIMGTIDDFFRFYKTDDVIWSRHHDFIIMTVQNSRVWFYTEIGPALGPDFGPEPYLAQSGDFWSGPEFHFTWNLYQILDRIKYWLFLVPKSAETIPLTLFDDVIMT